MNVRVLSPSLSSSSASPLRSRWGNRSWSDWDELVASVGGVGSGFADFGIKGSVATVTPVPVIVRLHTPVAVLAVTTPRGGGGNHALVPDAATAGISEYARRLLVYRGGGAMTPLQGSEIERDIKQLTNQALSSWLTAITRSPRLYDRETRHAILNEAAKRLSWPDNYALHST